MLCFDDDFESVDNGFLKFYLRVIYSSVDDNCSKSLEPLYFTSEFFRLLFFLHRTLSTLISVLLDLLTFTRSLSLLPPPLSLSLFVYLALSLSLFCLYIICQFCSLIESYRYHSFFGREVARRSTYQEQLPFHRTALLARRVYVTCAAGQYGSRINFCGCKFFYSLDTVTCGSQILNDYLSTNP